VPLATARSSEKTLSAVFAAVPLAVRNNTSNTLTAADQFVANRPVHDYTPDPARPPVVAAYSGISGFSASSSGSQYRRFMADLRVAALPPWEGQ